jgi:hypothetical protein
MLVNPNFADADTQSRDAQEAALALGLELHVLRASTERDLDAAFATLVQRRADALVVGNDFFQYPARSAGRIGRTSWRTDDLSISGFRSGRRPDELRHQPLRLAT